MEILNLKIIDDKIELEIEDKRQLEIFSVFVSTEKFQSLISKLNLTIKT